MVAVSATVRSSGEAEEEGDKGPPGFDPAAKTAGPEDGVS
jgi:hypothetical protein